MPRKPNLCNRGPHAIDCDCEACLTEYGDHFEAVLLMDRLADRDPERLGAVPATDREWQEYLDREFPRVTQPHRTGIDAPNRTSTN